MSSPTRQPRRTNGRKDEPPICRHEGNCEWVQSQRDLGAQLQRMDERHNRVSDAMVGSLSIISGELKTIQAATQNTALRVSDFGRRLVVTEQRAGLTERLITALVRHVAETAGPEAGKKLSDELAAIQANAARELGGADA